MRKVLKLRRASLKITAKSIVRIPVQSFPTLNLNTEKRAGRERGTGGREERVRGDGNAQAVPFPFLEKKLRSKNGVREGRKEGREGREGKGREGGKGGREGLGGIMIRGRFFSRISEM